MIDGQAKAFDKELQTLPQVTENTENTATMIREGINVNTLEIKVRQIYQLNRRKRISKSKSSRIL